MSLYSLVSLFQTITAWSCRFHRVMFQMQEKGPPSFFPKPLPLCEKHSQLFNSVKNWPLQFKCQSSFFINILSLPTLFVSCTSFIITFFNRTTWFSSLEFFEIYYIKYIFSRTELFSRTEQVILKEETQRIPYFIALSHY